jgi:hypothetical protein
MPEGSHDFQLIDLEGLLDAHGSDQARWPEAKRIAAAGLLARSSEARDLLATQSAIDGLLDAAEEIQPSAELRRRIAEVPARDSKSAVEWGLLGRRWWMALTAATAVTFGAVSGWALPPEPLSAEAEEVEWESLSELALADDLSEDWQ